MPDLPAGHGFGRTPPPPAITAASNDTKKRAKPKRRGARRGEDFSDASPSARTHGVVQVTAENAPQVHAVLLQQIRDWQIRNHRLLREAVYYLRCIAENDTPTDAQAKTFIDAPPEKAP